MTLTSDPLTSFYRDSFVVGSNYNQCLLDCILYIYIPLDEGFVTTDSVLKACQWLQFCRYFGPSSCSLGKSSRLFGIPGCLAVDSSFFSHLSWWRPMVQAILLSSFPAHHGLGWWDEIRWLTTGMTMACRPSYCRNIFMSPIYRLVFLMIESLLSVIFIRRDNFSFSHLCFLQPLCSVNLDLPTWQ